MLRPSSMIKWLLAFVAMMTVIARPLLAVDVVRAFGLSVQQLFGQTQAISHPIVHARPAAHVDPIGGFEHALSGDLLMILIVFGGVGVPLFFVLHVVMGRALRSIETESPAEIEAAPVAAIEPPPAVLEIRDTFFRVVSIWTWSDDNGGQLAISLTNMDGTPIQRQKDGHKWVIVPLACVSWTPNHDADEEGVVAVFPQASSTTDLAPAVIFMSRERPAGLPEQMFGRCYDGRTGRWL